MDAHNDSCLAHQLVLPVLNPEGGTLPARLLAERLGEVAGVCHAYVSAQTEMAWLIYDPARFDIGEAARALAAIGYAAGPPEPRDPPAGLHRLSERAR